MEEELSDDGSTLSAEQMWKLATPDQKEKFKELMESMRVVPSPAASIVPQRQINSRKSSQPKDAVSSASGIFNSPSPDSPSGMDFEETTSRTRPVELKTKSPASIHSRDDTKSPPPKRSRVQTYLESTSLFAKSAEKVLTSSRQSRIDSPPVDRKRRPRKNPLYAKFVALQKENDIYELANWFKNATRAAARLKQERQEYYEKQTLKEVIFQRYSFREPRANSPNPPLQEDRKFRNKIDCKLYYNIPLNEDEQNVHDEWRKIIPTGEFQFPYPPNLYFECCHYQHEAFFRKVHGDSLEPKMFPFKIHPAMKLYDFDRDANEFRKQAIKDLTPVPKIVLASKQQAVYDALPEFDPFTYYEHRPGQEPEWIVKSFGSKERSVSQDDLMESPEHVFDMDCDTSDEPVPMTDSPMMGAESPMERSQSPVLLEIRESPKPDVVVDRPRSPILRAPVVRQSSVPSKVNPSVQVPRQTSVQEESSSNQPTVREFLETVNSSTATAQSSRPEIDQTAWIQQEAQTIDRRIARAKNLQKKRERILGSERTLADETMSVREFLKNKMMRGSKEGPAEYDFSMEKVENSMESTGQEVLEDIGEIEAEEVEKEKTSEPVPTPEEVVQAPQVVEETVTIDKDNSEKPTTSEPVVQDDMLEEEPGESVHRAMISKSEERLLLGDSPDEHPAPQDTKALERSPTPDLLKETYDEPTDRVAFDQNALLDEPAAPLPIEDPLLDEPTQPAGPSSPDERLYNEMYGVLDDVAMPTAEQERELLDGVDEPVVEEVPEAAPEKVETVVKKRGRPAKKVRGKKAVTEAPGPAPVPEPVQEEPILEPAPIPEDSVPEPEPAPEPVQERAPAPAPEPSSVPEDPVPEPVAQEVVEQPTPRRTRSKAVATPAAKPPARRATRKAAQEPEKEPEEQKHEDVKTDAPSLRKRRRNEDSPPPEPTRATRAKRLFLSKNNPNPRARTQVDPNAPSTSAAPPVVAADDFHAVELPAAIRNLIEQDDDLEILEFRTVHTPKNPVEIKPEPANESWEIPPPISEISRTSKKRQRQEQERVLAAMKQELEPDDEYEVVRVRVVRNPEIKPELEDPDFRVDKITYNLSENMVELEPECAPAKLIRADAEEKPDQKYLTMKRIWEEMNRVFITDPYTFSQLALFLTDKTMNPHRVFHYTVKVNHRFVDFDHAFVNFLAGCDKKMTKEQEKYTEHTYFTSAYRNKSSTRILHKNVTGISLYKVIEHINDVRKLIEEEAKGLIGSAEKDNLQTVENILLDQFITCTMKMADLSTLLNTPVDHLNRRLEMMQSGWNMFLRAGGFFRVLLALNRTDVQKMSEKFREYCVEYYKDIENNYRIVLDEYMKDDDEAFNEIMERGELTQEDIEMLDSDVQVKGSDIHSYKCTTCRLVNQLDVFFSSQQLLDKHQKLHEHGLMQGGENDCGKCYDEFLSRLLPYHRIVEHFSLKIDEENYNTY